LIVNRPSRAVPICFCEEKNLLMRQFLAAIHEVTALSSQQTEAVIADDPGYGRFAALIRAANERKETAKRVLLTHIEAHRCAEINAFGLDSEEALGINLTRQSGAWKAA
jgi:hypothetical protein